MRELLEIYLGQLHMGKSRWSTIQRCPVHYGVHGLTLRHVCAYTLFFALRSHESIDVNAETRAVTNKATHVSPYRCFHLRTWLVLNE